MSATLLWGSLRSFRLRDFAITAQLKNSTSVKTESIRKLSNFNFQWTKTLYQNNLKHIAFFFTFFESYGYNLLSVITPKTMRIILGPLSGLK